MSIKAARSVWSQSGIIIYFSKYMMNTCETCGHKNGKCTWRMLSKILLIIGGLNWGLVGVGMILMHNWNIVNMLLGGMPTIEAIVYILVGIAAVMKLIGCKCKKCNSCNVGAPASMSSTGGNM